VSKNRVEIPKVPASPMDMFELHVYLKWLEDNHLDYHLDDNVESIVWNHANATPEAIAYVKVMALRMWADFTHNQIWDAAGEVWTCWGELADEEG
jgi:hypothetical protein